jgi:hypothetical protein
VVALEAALDKVQDGDTLVVAKLDWLARSVAKIPTGAAAYRAASATWPVIEWPPPISRG